MSERHKNSSSSGISCYSREFSDFDVACKSLEIDETETEDIYEMALEVLEADEAFRLESSGSISPESDVDRLLENADTERYSGDVTLVRIFSIRQDDACISTDDLALPVKESPDQQWNVSRKRNLPTSLVSNSVLDKPLGSVEYRQVWTTGNDLGKVKSEPSIRKFRTDSDELVFHQAFDGADFVSVDLNSDSQSVESDVFLAGPNVTAERNSADPVAKRDPQLVCTAKFSNIKSKDAKIRTALTLTSNSPHEIDEGRSGDGTESDVSLHVTSSDSLYSTTDDCFGDPVLANLKPGCYGTMNAYTSSDDERLRLFPAFAFRDPSPEELFDEALETRSDLAGSICSSIQMSPQFVYFDAVQCSPVCVHRDPSPEDEFDLALETLSDVVDDSSSSVFIIASRQNDQKPEATLVPESLLGGFTDGADSQTDFGKMVDDGSSSIDLDILRLHDRVPSSAGSSRSSCEALPDDNPSHLGRLLGVANAGESSDPFTADEFSEEAKGDRCRFYLDPWSSDCPSSPEPSCLAEYSTDDCVGESEGDESLTDYEASTGIESTSKSNFFHRLLRRRDLREAMDRWEESRVADRGDLLDKIQICSIEDLLTDSESERDFRKASTGESRYPSECSPVVPLAPAFVQPCTGGDDLQKVPEHRSSADPSISLSPPIALAVRADIQFARKSKIPKLPEARNALSPVRISW